jgi:hypothetical protein
MLCQLSHCSPHESVEAVRQGAKNQGLGPVVNRPMSRWLSSEVPINWASCRCGWACRPGLVPARDGGAVRGVSC